MKRKLIGLATGGLLAMLGVGTVLASQQASPGPDASYRQAAVVQQAQDPADCPRDAQPGSTPEGSTSSDL